jgi:hypothetical protein
MRRSRQRTLLMLLLLLTGGAIVNVAVTWGLAIFAPLRFMIAHNGVFGPTTLPNWDIVVISRAGAVLVDARASATRAREGPPFHRHAIPSWSLASSAPLQIDAQQNRSFQEIAYGWPLTSSFSRNNWNRRPREWGLVIPWFAKYDDRTLPLRPIWPGFAINTVFYAALLRPVSLVPGMVRRTIRRTRGQCPACAYPIGTSNVCTECGAAVRAQM